MAVMTSSETGHTRIAWNARMFHTPLSRQIHSLDFDDFLKWKLQVLQMTSISRIIQSQMEANQLLHVLRPFNPGISYFRA